MSFKPAAGGRELVRTFQPESAGITLLTLAKTEAPIVWQSEFDCASTDPPNSGPSLQIVQTTAPAALSLLLSEQTSNDKLVHQMIGELRDKCGENVSTQDVLEGFGLADLITSRWPDQLPVRCPI